MFSQTETSGRPKRNTGKAVALVFACLAAFAVVEIIGRIDNTTELTPNHDGVSVISFCGAGLIGLGLAALAVQTSEGWALWRRAGMAFGLLLGGVALGFNLLQSAADLVMGMIDFPPGKTQTYPALLVISRAYQSHGKSRSWNIQTSPVLSNFEIMASDYNSMLEHRRPGDTSRNPDEISSQGYFCARVSVQQAGDAIRVLHAGHLALPKGSVILCPSAVTQAWSSQRNPRTGPARQVVAWRLGAY